MKSLYYTLDGRRVKIVKVFTSGECEVRDRNNVRDIQYIGDLKKVI